MATGLLQACHNITSAASLLDLTVPPSNRPFQVFFFDTDLECPGCEETG